MKKTFAKLLACGMGAVLLMQAAVSAAAYAPDAVIPAERFDAESLSAVLGKEVVEIYQRPRKDPRSGFFGCVYTTDKGYNYTRVISGLSVTYADGTTEFTQDWKGSYDETVQAFLSDPDVICVENCYEYLLDYGYSPRYQVWSDQPLTEASFSVPCTVRENSSNGGYYVYLESAAILREENDSYTDEAVYQLYLSNLEAIRSGEGVEEAYIAMVHDEDGDPDYIISTAEHESILFRGDLDGSGDLGLRDAVLSAKLLGEDHTANVLTQNADMNADGCLDLRDFRLLVQRLS